MARGTSGRVVLEIEPMLKRQLYAALAMDESTLKDWFIAMAENYVGSQQQRNLFSEPKQTASEETKNELY